MNASLGLLCLLLISVVSGRPTVFQGEIPAEGQVVIQVDGDSTPQVSHQLNFGKDEIAGAEIKGRSFSYAGDYSGGGGFMSTILASIGLGSYAGNYDSYGSYGNYDDDAYGGTYGNTGYGSYGSSYDGNYGSYGSYGNSGYDNGYYNMGYGDYGRSAHPLRNVY